MQALTGKIGLLEGIGEAAREEFLLSALILVPALYLSARVSRTSRTSPVAVI